jgi:hypothetical protein
MVDYPRGKLPLAPDLTPTPEANRRRLEELLRELLRDETIRQLFCNQEGLRLEPQIDRKPRRLKVSLRLVTAGVHQR